MGLSSGYSSYSLQTEERAASAFVAHRTHSSGSTRHGAKPIYLLRALPGAGDGGTQGRGRGAAGRRSCCGHSALTVKQQQAGMREPVAHRILAV